MCPHVASVTANDAVLARHANHSLYPREAFNLVLVQGGDLTNDVDLGQRAAGAGDGVSLGRNAGLGIQVAHYRLAFGGLQRVVRV